MRFIEYLNESSNPKYPRTLHLPWSEEVHSDDKVLEDVSGLLNTPLTITAKMDGSNVGLSFKSVTSRSGHPDSHPSFDLIKQKHATIKYDIPQSMIIYGEWLYAVHSIEYENLDDYLLVFAILDNNNWLSFKEVKEYCNLLELKTVPLIKNNVTFKTEEKLQQYTTKVAKETIKKGHEGIVVRKSESFKNFPKYTAKYVRRGHVQTDNHWKFQEIKVQKIKG